MCAQVLVLCFLKLHNSTIKDYAKRGENITNSLGNELQKHRQVMLLNFKEIHHRTNKNYPPFHGIPWADPLGSVLHTALSPDSTLEIRFAMMTLSVLSVVTRSWSSDDELDLNGIMLWAAVIYTVILFPYSLIASFVYKPNIWDENKSILVPKSGSSHQGSAANNGQEGHGRFRYHLKM